MFIKFNNDLVLSVEHIVSVRKMSENEYQIRMLSSGHSESADRTSHRITKHEYDCMLYLLGSMRSNRALCDIKDPAVQRSVSLNANDKPAA